MSKDSVIVYIEPLETLSTGILPQLYLLNNRIFGRMQCNLKYYGTQNARMKNAKIFYTLNKGKVASWGVVYNPQIYTTSNSGFSKQWDMDLYTRKAERGKGYGSAIVEVATEEFRGKIIHACRSMTSIYARNGIKS